MIADLRKFLKKTISHLVCVLYSFCHVVKKIHFDVYKKILFVEDEFKTFLELLVLPTSPSVTFHYLSLSKDSVLSVK